MSLAVVEMILGLIPRVKIVPRGGVVPSKLIYVESVVPTRCLRYSKSVEPEQMFSRLSPKWLGIRISFCCCVEIIQTWKMSNDLCCVLGEPSSRRPGKEPVVVQTKPE